MHNTTPQTKTATPAADRQISDYEMHVTRFAEGSQLRSFTYRGDKTLEYYTKMKAYHKPANQLNALLLKFRNSPRILDATIYDNTGDVQRVAIVTIQNKVIVNDLTGNL